MHTTSIPCGTTRRAATNFTNLISLCRVVPRSHSRRQSGARVSSRWSKRGLPFEAFLATIGGSQPRHPGKRLPRARRLVRSFSKVVRIEYAGEEMTYDLEVAGPWHNFVANGFIVHNSVNEYSGRYSLMPMLFYTPTRRSFRRRAA